LKKHQILKSGVILINSIKYDIKALNKKYSTLSSQKHYLVKSYHKLNLGLKKI